jgi:hypothetical protein
MVQIMKFLIMEPSPLPIALRILFSNAFSLRPSINIIVLYILILKVLERNRVEKIIWTD